MTASEMPEPGQLQTIAMIGGTDAETRTIVEETLGAIGVVSFIEGSAVYGVQVYQRDAARARAALQAEPRMSGRWVSYVD